MSWYTMRSARVIAFVLLSLVALIVAAPLAMKPMASVMPASTDKLATIDRPMRPRHLWVCKWPGVARVLEGKGSIDESFLEQR